MYNNIPRGSGFILLTVIVSEFTDETFDVWLTEVDLVNCWLTVVLNNWAVVKFGAITGSGGVEFAASKISKKIVKFMHMIN